MPHNWNTTTFTDEAEVFPVLAELRGKQWLCRGQPDLYNNLVPSIDRDSLQKLSRQEKLMLERQGMDIFRSTARFFANQGEQLAMTSDVTTIMVLRHYGVPTRLLDWSYSPEVATYFACQGSDTKDGEIWCFDPERYELKGGEQWERWPEATRGCSGKGSDFNADLTMFKVEEPKDWFVCFHYPKGFPRQDAQQGVYSLTARFGRDHAEAIESLLAKSASHHLYVVPARLKPSLRKLLRENYGIWRGSLFPDSAGAAETARTAFSRTSD